MAKPKEAHIYLPPDVFEQLKKLAKKNRRSMSMEIVIAIEDRIKKESRKK